MVDSKQQWKAWIYLAPAIALLLVFTVWPIFNTVRMAFLENYSGLKAAAGMQFDALIKFPCTFSGTFVVPWYNNACAALCGFIHRRLNHLGVTVKICIIIG